MQPGQLSKDKRPKSEPLRSVTDVARVKSVGRHEVEVFCEGDKRDSGVTTVEQVTLPRSRTYCPA